MYIENKTAVNYFFKHMFKCNKNKKSSEAEVDINSPEI